MDDRSDRVVRGKRTALGESVALNVLLRVSPPGLLIRASEPRRQRLSPFHRVKHTEQYHTWFDVKAGF